MAWTPVLACLLFLETSRAATEKEVVGWHISMDRCYTGNGTLAQNFKSTQ